MINKSNNLTNLTNQTINQTHSTNYEDNTIPTFHQLITQIPSRDLSFQEKIFLNTEVNKSTIKGKEKTRLKIWQQGAHKEEEREMSMRNKFLEIKNAAKHRAPGIVDGHNQYLNQTSL